MIIAVCLNPALDITHHVAAVDWSGVNRPTAVHTRPGGKGVNVARTLHVLGADAQLRVLLPAVPAGLLLGLAGGPTGAAIETALRELGVPTDFTPIAGDSRRTFTVVDGPSGDAPSGDSLSGDGPSGDGPSGAGQRRVAVFNEPGPEVTPAEFTLFRARYAAAPCPAALARAAA